MATHRVSRLGFLACLAALTFTSVAVAKLAKTGGSSVAFSATGPGGLKIDGKSSEVSLGDDGTTVTVIVPLANLTTDIELRDKHMKEKYLEVGKYPNAELKVPRASLKVPSADAEVDESAQGTMTLHGQTKPVTFKYQARRSGDSIGVSGSVRVNLKDHGIEVPSYLGVTVKPDVDVRVKFSAKDN